MILHLASGKAIRGDWVINAVLRNDLAPVPVTLEADFRAGDALLERGLAEGKTLSTGQGDVLRIIKSTRQSMPVSQDNRELAAISIIAVLDACHAACFVRRRAIVKAKATLAGIYRAAGCSLQAIDADFSVPRFVCLAGETPTFHIARILQEEGGLVRWKSGRLQFMRLPDVFRQKPAMEVPTNRGDTVASGFLERHDIPFFYSTAPDGSLIYGNRGKTRSARFMPGLNAQKLRNMTRCLVHRRTARMGLSMRLCAGDVVSQAGAEPLAIVTAAHVFQSGTDSGGASNTYTKLWLSSMEE